MKLSSKCFLLAALIVLGFVSGASAAEKWTGIKCYDEYPDDEYAQIFTKVCYVGQFASQDEATEKGYSGDDMASVWGGTDGFLEKLNRGIHGAMQSCSWDGMCYGFELRFETDIDLGGFEVSNGDTVCVNTFDPVLIPVDVLTNYVTEINGNGKTIKGYCDIGEGNRSFFKGIEDFGGTRESIAAVRNARFSNLHFDGAYVKATGDGARAAVLAEQSYGIAFNNVSVANSVISASHTAGGLVGNYETAYDDITSVHVDAVLRGVHVGGLFGEAIFASAEMASSVSNISVDIEVYAVGEDSVAAGGFAGQFTMRDANIVFSNDTVTLVMPNGATTVVAGGLVGNFLYDASRSVEMLNLGNIIDISVNSTGYIAYAGGLVGTGAFPNVSVTDSLNKIHAVIATKGSGDGVVAAGGEFGQILNANGLRVAYDAIDARLVAAGSQRQRLGGVIGDVQMVATGEAFVGRSDIKASIASSGTGGISVAMGGMVAYATEGSAEQYNGLTVNSEANRFTVSMEASATNEIYAGGVVGYMDVKAGGPWPAGGFRAMATSVKAIADNDLIKVSSNSVNRLYAGGLTGVVYSPEGENKVLQVKVEGDIDIATENFADSSAVGGLFGEMLSYRTTIYDNISVGNILTNAANTGFVVGKYFVRERYSRYGGDEFESGSYGTKFITNVHYGTKDAKVKDVFGSIGWLDMTYDQSGNPIDSVYVPVVNWSENAEAIGDFGGKVLNNYRNAIESETSTLAPTGSLDVSGSGLVLADGVYQWNGILDDSTMKSRLFTYSLTEKETITSNYRTNLDSLKCWENDAGSLPHPCTSESERTAYKVSVFVDDIYSKFTDADKESLEGILDSMELEETTSYYLVAYTEQNKRVSENFLNRARALSVDYGVTFESSEFDLETYVFGNNMGLMAEENSSFYVVYEVEEVVEEEPTGNYVNLDESLLYPVYLWPKVTSVSRYNEHAVVPPVFAMGENSKQEYYVERYYVNCRNGEVCETDVIEGEFSGMGDFAEVVGNIAYNYGSEYSDTIHLVYAPAGYSETPKVRLGVGNYRKLEFTGYGYREGELVAFNDTIAGGLDYPLVPMASRYSVEPELGFVLKRWKADLWVHSTDYVDIDYCYDEYYVPESCNNAAKYESAKDYFASSGTILNAMVEYGDGDVNMKWSTELDAGSMLVMDSVVAAIARSSRAPIDRSYSYFLHVDPVLEAIPYAIQFEINAGDAPVFVAGYTDTLAFYSREDYRSSELLDLYSADTTRCFGGWSTNAEEPLNYTYELDKELLEQVTPVNNKFSLYGIWHKAMTMDVTGADAGPGTTSDEEVYECPDVQTTELALHYLGDAGSEGGEVYLWQRVVNPDDTLTFRHDFKDSAINIPDRYGAVFRFHVAAVANPGYTLSQVKFVRGEPYASNAPPLAEYAPDVPGSALDTIVLDIPNGDDTIEVSYDWKSYALYATFEKYFAVMFDLNTEQDEVFYDPRFVLGDSLVVVNNSDQVELPSSVYTVNSCIEGWSIESNAEKADYHVMTYNYRLYKETFDTKKLYAVWRDVQECVESLNYVRVSAEAENGMVELVEEGEEEKRVHRFGNDGSLILPAWSDGIFVNAVPDDGYELDHIELVQAGDTVRVENGGWLDVQEETIKLIAYFVEVGNSPEVAGPVFSTSGNAVQFKFNGYAYPKGEDSSVRIMLENDAGDTIENKEFSCLDGLCSIEWQKFPLRAGNYLFTAYGVDSIPFERDFEVAAAIAIAGENTWQMISLASVDLDELAWDGDEKFYWWAEDRSYGKYWQYQELTKGQVPDPERGYWYSSLEGRPLVLKDEFFYAENVAWNLENVNSGWNLVANPYGWYIDIDAPEPIDEDWFMEEMHSRSEDLDEEYLEEEWKNMQPLVQFWRWNAEAGAPEPCNGTFTLKPYEAVWVKLNDSVPMTWELNAYPSFAESVDVHGEKRLNKSLNHRLAKETGKNGWSLRLTLSDGKGKKDSWNTLGVGKFARTSEEPPAGMGDHVNLSIVEGGQRLAKSVKAETAAAAYEWNVELSATSARNGFLEISGIAALESRGLAVYVEVDGNRTRMQDGVPLKVALTSASKSARVYVGGTPKVALSKSLDGLRVVQAGAMLQVGFIVGEGLAGSAVHVDVLDLRGNVVRSTGAQAQSGTNQLAFDAPKPGIYMLRVRAGSQMRAGRILVK